MLHSGVRAPDPPFFLPSQSSEATEARRLAALERLEILDSLPEKDFDDLALLASQVCGVPMALVSFVDGNRQWFKARVGLEASETPRDIAFCDHAIRTPDSVFVVDDASRDARFADNPLVTGDPHIRFYAGAPILDRDGLALGTVCVIDTKTVQFDAAQRRCLEALARHASLLLDLRRQALDAARAGDALIERNQRLEQDVDAQTREVERLWDSSDDLHVALDRDQRLLRASPSWRRTFASGEGSFATQVHPDDHAVVQAALTAAWTGQAPTTVEHRLVAAGGTHRWIAWTWTRDPGGARVEGVGRDVTALREQQAALEAAEAALRQSQKMEALGQLTGGLAHDFNNLLTGITGSLELMQMRVAQGRTRELDRYLAAAQGAAKRAAALTHRLLAFARRQTLDPKPTDIERLVAGLEEMVRQTAAGPQIALEVTTAPGLWAAMVDANQLENALLNLCINARDSMPAGGRLAIEATNRTFDAAAAAALDLSPGQYLSLSVADTGTGMSDDVIKRAFDPFFTTKPLGAGTGLGLSMVYGFARQSGGQVRIASTPGQGTTMSLFLPRHVGTVDEVDEGEWAPLATDVGRGEVILVVDDEPTVRMLIAEVIEDMGYRSIEAQDGTAGLKVLQSDARVDLLITDVGLPGGLNGRQVADAARLLRPALKVLFITGYAEHAVVDGSQPDAGMQVLTKPFPLDALSQRIGDMLGSATGRDR